MPDVFPSRGLGHRTRKDDFANDRGASARLPIVTNHAPLSTDGRLDLLEPELIQKMPDLKLADDGMEIAL